MCDFCERFDFGSAACEVDKYGARLTLAGGLYRFPRHKQFNYCPNCGKQVSDIMNVREQNDAHMRSFFGKENVRDG